MIIADEKCIIFIIALLAYHCVSQILKLNKMNLPLLSLSLWIQDFSSAYKLLKLLAKNTSFQISLSIYISKFHTILLQMKFSNFGKKRIIVCRILSKRIVSYYHYHYFLHVKRLIHLHCTLIYNLSYASYLQLLEYLLRSFLALKEYVAAMISTYYNEAAVRC